MFDGTKKKSRKIELLPPKKVIDSGLCWRRLIKSQLTIEKNRRKLVDEKSVVFTMTVPEYKYFWLVDRNSEILFH